MAWVPSEALACHDACQAEASLKQYQVCPRAAPVPAQP